MADLAEDQGKAVADEVGGLYVQADVTDPKSVEAMFTATLASTAP